MFLQEATPDTSGYMIAGYAVAFIVMALYVLSLYLRSRNLNQDLTMLEELDKTSAPAKTSQPKPTLQTAAKAVTKQAREK